MRAYHETFGLPVNITWCFNNYGPYQFPEKLIPLMIHNALEDKALPVYGDGMQIRDWLHVQDHCAAIATVLEKGRVGEGYNIGGNNEKANIQIVRFILLVLGKPESLIKHVQDRPGHDRRYAIDNTKITTELGWVPPIPLSAVWPKHPVVSGTPGVDRAHHFRGVPAVLQKHVREDERLRCRDGSATELMQQTTHTKEPMPKQPVIARDRIIRLRWRGTMAIALAQCR